MGASKTINAIKAQSQITFYMWGALAASGLIATCFGDYSSGFMALTVLIASFLPIFFERWSGIIVPKYFGAGVVFFIIATLFLGEVFDFYNRFWWWDAVLHTGSAVGFGLIGFAIVFALIGGDRNSHSAWVVALLAFSFAVMIGAVWEIFEFAMDQIFGLNMQKSGIIDTMWDLIVDTIGAFVAAISGWNFMRGKKGLGLFTPVIHKFVLSNLNKFKKFGSKDR